MSSTYPCVCSSSKTLLGRTISAVLLSSLHSLTSCLLSPQLNKELLLNRCGPACLINEASVLFFYFASHDNEAAEVLLLAGPVASCLDFGLLTFYVETKAGVIRCSVTLSNLNTSSSVNHELHRELTYCTLS